MLHTRGCLSVFPTTDQIVCVIRLTDITGEVHRHCCKKIQYLGMHVEVENYGYKVAF